MVSCTETINTSLRRPFRPQASHAFQAHNSPKTNPGQASALGAPHGVVGGIIRSAHMHRAVAGATAAGGTRVAAAAGGATRAASGGGPGRAAAIRTTAWRTATGH